MKVLVTGVSGQLGHDVMNELDKRGYTGIGSDIADNYSGIQDNSAVTTMEYVKMDITDEAVVDEVISSVSPDVIIHCAAWTAVDMAEDDDKVEKVRAVNAKRTTEEIFPEAKSIANVNAYIISNPVKKQWDNKDDDYFLYVGNMEKRKGVDLLIKGYLQYKSRGGKKKLILGGKMQEEEINQIVRSAMMLDEDITYLDYVTHDKKHELYASMSAFVFPSKAEGFGMPIIEVMRFKKPIIASNLPIFDEITDGNINTFNIRCNEYEQINNLADELLSYNTEVDTEAYANVVKRYAPDRLGKVVYDFITSD